MTIETANKIFEEYLIQPLDVQSIIRQKLVHCLSLYNIKGRFFDYNSQIRLEFIYDCVKFGRVGFERLSFRELFNNFYDNDVDSAYKYNYVESFKKEYEIVNLITFVSYLDLLSSQVAKDIGIKFKYLSNITLTLESISNNKEE